MSRIKDEVMKLTSQLPSFSGQPRPPRDENRIPRSGVGMRMMLFDTIDEIDKLEESLRKVELMIPVRPDQTNNPLKDIPANRVHITTLTKLLASQERP